MILKRILAYFSNPKKIHECSLLTLILFLLVKLLLDFKDSKFGP